MAVDIKALAGLAAAALAGERRSRVEESGLLARTLTIAVCAFLAVACGFSAVVAGSIALWIFALPYTGSLGAALMVAAIWLVACASMTWVTLALLRPKAAPVAAPAPQVAAEQLLGQGLQMVRDHKGAMLLAALIAGMVSAES